MGRPEKHVRMSIKIDPDLLQFFKKWCHENQDNMSAYIKRHILHIKKQYEAEQRIQREG